jgi:hypothetical protein
MRLPCLCCGFINCDIKWAYGAQGQRGHNEEKYRAGPGETAFFSYLLTLEWRGRPKSIAVRILNHTRSGVLPVKEKQVDNLTPMINGSS